LGHSSDRKDGDQLDSHAFSSRGPPLTHCDLPCGIYDPAQARIEAESIEAICEKYEQNTDPAFRTPRC
jgi:nickel superoxide dismutase